MEKKFHCSCLFVLIYTNFDFDNIIKQKHKEKK